MDDILMYCEFVKRGKPAANLPLQERLIESALKIAHGVDGVQTYIEDLDAGWVTFWIYKHPHILDVIKAVPQVPKTAYDHWVLGKLFGYEEVAIGEYIASRSV